MPVAGTTIRVRVTTVDEDGDLFDPASGTFSYGVAGDKNGTSVTLATFTKDAVGKYNYAITPATAGSWWWKVSITDGGGNVLIERDTFTIDPDG